MIPKVKTWIVKGYRNGAHVRTVEVDTINKRFAVYFARRERGLWLLDLTVSVKRADDSRDHDWTNTDASAGVVEVEECADCFPERAILCENCAGDAIDAAEYALSDR